MSGNGSVDNPSCIPRRANTLGNSSETQTLSSPGVPLSTSPDGHPVSRYSGGAIDCRKHRRLALRSTRLSLYSERYEAHFPPSFSVSSRSLSGTSVGLTRCNKFAIVPHNCLSRGRRIPRPDLGGCDLAPRATGISRGLPGILPCH